LTKDTILAVALLLTASCRNGRGLREELSQASAKNGLALIRIQGNGIEIVTFNGEFQPLPNPFSLSKAWFSVDGSWVAWNLLIPDRPSPMLVRSASNVESGRLPGNYTNIATAAIAPDGRKIALHGTTQNATRPITGPITGLHYGEIGGPTVLLTSEDAGTTISWAPDSSMFVYDRAGRVLVFSTTGNRSREIALGSHPSWSPDGNWIAIRLYDGTQVLVDPKTGQRKAFLSGRKTLGSVHWSPDGMYVMFAEALDMFSNWIAGRMSLFNPSGQLVVYRLRDGASLSVHLFDFKGGDDRGFFWIQHYRTFAATLSPQMEP
jgi:hypothetical protein